MRFTGLFGLAALVVACGGNSFEGNGAQLAAAGSAGTAGSAAGAGLSSAGAGAVSGGGSAGQGAGGGSSGASGSSGAPGTAGVSGADSCGAGYAWNGQQCCLEHICVADSLHGGPSYCGDTDDGCGQGLTVHCPAQCPMGGACGVQDHPDFCSCWQVDYDPSFPCNNGMHKYQCWKDAGGVAYQPTIQGCSLSSADTTGQLWCCP